jgi:hypothetical protein
VDAKNVDRYRDRQNEDLAHLREMLDENLLWHHHDEDDDHLNDQHLRHVVDAHCRVIANGNQNEHHHVADDDHQR